MRGLSYISAMRLDDDRAAKIEAYAQELWPELPAAFLAARRASDQLNKSAISLSAVEARMMSFLIRQNKCKKFVEIGTLTGFSALWILAALPTDGELWTLELDPHHAQAAREVLAEDPRAHVIEGDAQKTLEDISVHGPFDGIFIDGNKAAYVHYLNWAEKNLRTGGLILADNVFLGGSVLPGGEGWGSEKQTEIMKQLNRRLANPNHYESCLIPTGEGLFAAVKK